MAENKTFDVIIIGGSYAGLSCAMALGRSLRNVLIIDSGKPCNLPTPHSHNFLTQDGKTPREISSIARQQVEAYSTITFHDGLAVSGIQNEFGFEITTDSNNTYTGKKLVFATGIRDMIPDIPGFAACWGISIIHCPYCHGYEYRNKNTAILAVGHKAYHLASLVRNLTERVTVLTNGEVDLTHDQTENLARNNIQIIDTSVAEFEHNHGHVTHVIFHDGTKMSFDAVYAAIPFVQHSDIPESLGCDINEHGYIKIDHFHKTNIDGVFACGDNSNMMRSVANAVYAGNFTGALVNAELVNDVF